MVKKVFVIVNPASGKTEPILSMLNSVLLGKVEYDIGITKKQGDGYTLAKNALKKKYDIIAVYGGDGTVMEAAAALYNRKTPLLILPGGTANILSKEIGIPQNTTEALDLIVKNKIKYKKIDMGLMNKMPFAVAVNIGYTAKIMQGAKRKHKSKYGRLAYGISAIKHKNPPSSLYTIHHDHGTSEIEGVAIVITNTANSGLSGLSIMSDIRIDDGKLDIFVVKNSDIASLIEIAKSAVLEKKPHENIMHIRSSKFKISINPGQLVECDDIFEEYSELTIQSRKNALTVIVP
jgi:YegS/Rv2252/BmrU family lipid kinase